MGSTVIEARRDRSGARTEAAHIDLLVESRALTPRRARWLGGTASRVSIRPSDAPRRGGLRLELQQLMKNLKSKMKSTGKKMGRRAKSAAKKVGKKIERAAKAVESKVA
jgi:predicted component of type VI protein secretion system